MLALAARREKQDVLAQKLLRELSRGIFFQPVVCSRVCEVYGAAGSGDIASVILSVFKIAENKTSRRYASAGVRVGLVKDRTLNNEGCGTRS